MFAHGLLEPDRFLQADIIRNSLANKLIQALGANGIQHVRKVVFADSYMA